MSLTLFLCFQFTFAELNSILESRNSPESFTGLVPNRDGGHLRIWTTLQWECENYKGWPKARCLTVVIHFICHDIVFEGKNPSWYLHSIYHEIYCVIYHVIYQDMYLIFHYNWHDCICLVAPYPYGPGTADHFDVKTDMNLNFSAERAFCGMLSHSCSSTVLLLPSGSWSEK
jgi:hypothetical protein